MDLGPTGLEDEPEPVGSVTLETGGVVLPGDLVVPPSARAAVVFAHGSGSSRRSPRNVAVAERLHEHGLGTLLFDLLTPDEADDRRNVFDIELLATRLVAAEAWVRERIRPAGLPVAVFGASTGAAAALVAATGLDEQPVAIVSRGGRPDLAADALELVTAPTLLIVGGRDLEVLALNREAKRRLSSESRIEVVPGAGHLFEEAGALERVAELAASWISVHVPDAG